MNYGTWCGKENCNITRRKNGQCSEAAFPCDRLRFQRLRKPNKIQGCSTQELLGRGCRALSTNLSDHPSCGECKLKVTHCTKCHPARQWATVREDFSGKLESTRCVKRLLREKAQHSEDKGTYKPFQYLMVWGHCQPLVSL